MNAEAAPTKYSFVRQVFPTWWISIPPEFEETFVRPEGYWHAWDDHRSVSLTSTQVHDPDRGGIAVPAAEIAAVVPAPTGQRIPLPPGFAGWAVVIPTPESPRASRAITSLLAVDGRVLQATITADDIAWSTEVLHSIEYAPGEAEPPRLELAASPITSTRPSRAARRSPRRNN